MHVTTVTLVAALLAPAAAAPRPRPAVPIQALANNVDAELPHFLSEIPVGAAPPILDELDSVAFDEEKEKDPKRPVLPKHGYNNRNLERSTLGDGDDGWPELPELPGAGPDPEDNDWPQWPDEDEVDHEEEVKEGLGAAAEEFQRMEDAMEENEQANNVLIPPSGKNGDPLFSHKDDTPAPEKEGALATENEDPAALEENDVSAPEEGDVQDSKNKGDDSKGSRQTGGDTKGLKEKGDDASKKKGEDSKGTKHKGNTKQREDMRRTLLARRGQSPMRQGDDSKGFQQNEDDPNGPEQNGDDSKGPKQKGGDAKRYKQKEVGDRPKKKGNAKQSDHIRRPLLARRGDPPASPTRGRTGSGRDTTRTRGRGGANSTGGRNNVTAARGRNTANRAGGRDDTQSGERNDNDAKHARQSSPVTPAADAGPGRPTPTKPPCPAHLDCSKWQLPGYEGRAECERLLSVGTQILEDSGFGSLQGDRPQRGNQGEGRDRGGQGQRAGGNRGNRRQGRRRNRMNQRQRSRQSKTNQGQQGSDGGNQGQQGTNGGNQGQQGSDGASHGQQDSNGGNQGQHGSNGKGNHE